MFDDRYSIFLGFLVHQAIEKLFFILIVIVCFLNLCALNCLCWGTWRLSKFVIIVFNRLRVICTYIAGAAVCFRRVAVSFSKLEFN